MKIYIQYFYISLKIHITYKVFKLGHRSVNCREVTKSVSLGKFKLVPCVEWPGSQYKGVWQCERILILSSFLLSSVRVRHITANTAINVSIKSHDIMLHVVVHGSYVSHWDSERESNRESSVHTADCTNELVLF